MNCRRLFHRRKSLRSIRFFRACFRETTRNYQTVRNISSHIGFNNEILFWRVPLAIDSDEYNSNIIVIYTIHLW